MHERISTVGSVGLRDALKALLDEVSEQVDLDRRRLRLRPALIHLDDRVQVGAGEDVADLTQRRATQLVLQRRAEQLAQLISGAVGKQQQHLAAVACNRRVDHRRLRCGGTGAVGRLGQRGQQRLGVVHLDRLSSICDSAVAALPLPMLAISSSALCWISVNRSCGRRRRPTRPRPRPARAPG
jgi:hypothetical protein